MRLVRLHYSNHSFQAFASIATEDLIELCQKVDTTALPIMLKEIEGVAEYWPISVRLHLHHVQRIADGNTSTTISAWTRIRDLCRYGCFDV